MVEWIGSVLAVLAPALMARFFPGIAKRNRVALLNELLRDRRFKTGRSLKELQRKTGMSADECRHLLSEIGAFGITLHDGSEGWRLPPKP